VITHYNFWGSNHISGKAEARVVKFYTQVGYVKCSPSDDKLLLKDTISVASPILKRS